VREVEEKDRQGEGTGKMSLRNGRQSSGFSLERVRLRRTLGQRFNHFGPCRCSAWGSSASITMPLRNTLRRSLRFMRTPRNAMVTTLPFLIVRANSAVFPHRIRPLGGEVNPAKNSPFWQSRGTLLSETLIERSILLLSAQMAGNLRQARQGL
jgi:hypothetical protein